MASGNAPAHASRDRDPVDMNDTTSTPVKTPTAAVIGAGVMGCGIAAVLARGGHRVTLVDATDQLAEKGVQRSREMIDEGLRRGKYSEPEAAAARSRLSWSSSLAHVDQGLDVIVEAVPEQEDLKRRVLVGAEEREPALLATNTSGISIDALATSLSEPERFLGLHFFNPVPVMPLVEIVIGHATSQEARSHALQIVEQIGKEAVVVRDAPGFASTRLGVLLGLEAIRMVEEGVAEPEDIDKAMVLGYRHPIGPLRLTDIVGLDVRLDIARNLQAAYGERFAAPELLREMVQEGRLGKKTGQGFYLWGD